MGYTSGAEGSVGKQRWPAVQVSPGKPATPWSPLKAQLPIVLLADLDHHVESMYMGRWPPTTTQGVCVRLTVAKSASSQACCGLPGSKRCSAWG